IHFQRSCCLRVLRGSAGQCCRGATSAIERHRSLLRSELQYDLPAELIAQTPSEPRDASRLLVLDRRTGELRHETFSRLPDLPPRAVLVLNDTRVLPARLQLRRATGGRLDGLFLRELEEGCWEVMIAGAARLKAGEVVELEGSAQTLVMLKRLDGGWRVRPGP